VPACCDTTPSFDTRRGDVTGEDRDPHQAAAALRLCRSLAAENGETACLLLEERPPRAMYMALWCSAGLLLAAAAAAPPWSDCVVGGRAAVSCFGPFNVSDSTEQLQAALSSNASVLIVDHPPGLVAAPWVVRPLFLRASDMRIVFQPGVTILAKRDEFHFKTDSLLKLLGVRNISIDGNGAVLRMRRDDYAVPNRGSCPPCRPYSKAEWRCGLWVQGCEDVTLRNLSVVESGGDGLFMTSGGANHQIPNRRIHVADCQFLSNYRQGSEWPAGAPTVPLAGCTVYMSADCCRALGVCAVSVIAAVDLLVERTTFANTSGTPPAAGAPHAHNAILIHVRGTTVWYRFDPCLSQGWISSPTSCRSRS
jgi:hypothetical protein